jgi:hypothetical protein
MSETALITNVHVFDGMSEQRIENASVVVERNLIKEGAYADLLHIDGDPLKDHSVLGAKGKHLEVKYGFSTI